MRSVTFDMVGMTLMAIGVILVSGGMLLWGYVAETRRPRARVRPQAVPHHREAGAARPGSRAVG